MTPLLPSGLHFWERGWLSSNAIFLDDGVSSVLIDTGYVTHSSLLLTFLGSHLHERTLDILVNTHLHSDHCGGNLAVQSEFSGVKTLIPFGLFQSVRDWDNNALSFEATGQSCPRFHADTQMHPGDIYNWAGFNWEVHASPGHDHDALLLFNPEHRILISADSLWANGFGVVFPEICGGTGFAEVSSSLNLIEKLNPKIVLPGHGPLIEDLPAALSVARSKIKRFIDLPELHASHAAKVLLKFKLLEWQSVDISDFKLWALSTPLLMDVHQAFFPSLTANTWIDNLVSELVKKNVARFDGLKLHSI
jgi:glyoxylase-like metal-dependent hydrolase (beta-lactamase superfamily II)